MKSVSKIKQFYCAKCWQEFDDPREHGAGSWFKGERLDEPCAGDIQRSSPATAAQIKAMKQTEQLPLDSGEPIRL